MKKDLDSNYDIMADKMVSFTPEQLREGWVLYDAEFYSVKTRKVVKIQTLNNGIEVGECGAKQIFQMKDGKYILEVEDEDGVEYFYSENIEDLI